MSYIDEIMMAHSKTDYPIPGPGAHFNDEKTMKKFDETKKSLFAVRKRVFKSKTSLP